eukprot:SAG22_NODE_5544_length_995_cov_1.309152_1_plen_311_part_00
MRTGFCLDGTLLTRKYRPSDENTYWKFGLAIAAEWNERRGLPKNDGWQHIYDRLDPAPTVPSPWNESQLLYNLHGACENLYAGTTRGCAERSDHPGHLMALGAIPGTQHGIDLDIMNATFTATAKVWDLEHGYCKMTCDGIMLLAWLLCCIALSQCAATCDKLRHCCHADTPDDDAPQLWQLRQTMPLLSDGTDPHLVAITAARLERPNDALHFVSCKALPFCCASTAFLSKTAPFLAVPLGQVMLDSDENRFSVMGHQLNFAKVSGYLPGNGAMLQAVAAMAAGFDGSTDAPGFPREWAVRSEGLKAFP